MGLKMGAGSSTAGAGELQVISIIASSAPGLSPLTRGTHMNVGSDRVFTRFIPAGAGNTVLDHFKFTIDSVYPRWRGEHYVENICNTRKNGLSPLARGTLTEPRPYVMQIRFIPAGAGNTPPCQEHQSRPTVYPRWRGEHTPPPFRLAVSCGLSPLARGTLSAPPALAPPARFIPAGAGNTLSIHNCF